MESKKPKFYKSLEDAVVSRQRTVERYPGDQFLTWGAAHAIVSRGTKRVSLRDLKADADAKDADDDAVRAASDYNPSPREQEAANTTQAQPQAARGDQTAASAAAESRDTESLGISHGDIGAHHGLDEAYVFRHDLRLVAGTPRYFSEPQMEAIVAAISCPTLHISATRGWPFIESKVRWEAGARSSTGWPTDTIRADVAHPEQEAKVIDPRLDKHRAGGWAPPALGS